MTKPVHIIVAEPSAIIFEGFAHILMRAGLSFTSSQAANLEETEKLICTKPRSVAVVNPAIVQHNVKAFNTLRAKWEKVQWLGLVYNYFNEQTLALFDGIIYISDSPEAIVASVKKAVASETKKSTVPSGNLLSDRETEVLQQLALGLSNKEIADKLNISVHTVITHRKNISQKTGIKTVSGLTIFAVVNKLIALDQNSLF